MYINNNIDYLKALKDKKLYLFGAGKIGRKICLWLDKRGYQVEAFIDNNSEIIGKTICERQVLSLEEYKILNSVNNNIIICGYENEKMQQLFSNQIYNYVCESCIDFGGGEDHYDEEFVKFQLPMCEFSGIEKSKIFGKYITKSMSVIDFGCGEGFLLKHIEAEKKIGIEVNDSARIIAEKNGISTVKRIDEVSDEWADVIISSVF